MAWKHNELLSDLAGHLRGPDRMVWTDMQLGPSGSPRPDVFTLQRSYSRPQPAAYEVKVSRSDFRSDTTSGKWQSYLEFAGSVVFAVPDSLVTVADIPDGCGLIVRKEATWRYARRPTIQRVTPPFDACMKLLIDGVDRVSTNSDCRPRRIDTWTPVASVRKKFGVAVELAARNLVAAQDRTKDYAEYAASEFDRVKREVEDHRQFLMAQVRKEAERFETAKSDLCDWLGIDHASSAHEVRRRIAKLRTDCSADSRVKAAEDAVSRARANLTHALMQLGDD